MKIHYSERWLPGGVDPVVALYPFLGGAPEDASELTAGRYDRWRERGPELFVPSPLAEADVAIFPGRWEQVAGDPAREALGRGAAVEAEAAGVPLAIFYWSDSDAPVDVTGATVFRTSLTAGGRRAREYAMPAWSEDFVDRYLGGAIEERAHRPRPTVGFCGFARPRTIRTRLARLGRGPSPHAVRDRALRRLGASPLLDTNIVLRSSFLGGAVGGSDADRTRVRREYVANLVGSDYVLCTRGAGNFSYRLYETLSCGRIPVFVNTDCVLPYEDAIDWRSLCVWVEESELDSIAELVASFHAQLDEHSFRELQHECRRVWLDRLSPEGWFAHFGEHFAS